MVFFRNYWSINYFWRKLGVVIYEKTKPGDPWLAKDANLYLQKKLKKSFRLLETGAGRSTIWFGERVGSVISIEHDPNWYQLVIAKIRKNHLKNIRLKLVKPLKYVDETKRLTRNFDVILVDGILRDSCALEATKHLKKGGMLIIDDSQRYMPYGSKRPETIGFGPPPSQKWKEFNRVVKNWEIHYFNNGVKDTTILVKRNNGVRKHGKAKK